MKLNRNKVVFRYIIIIDVYIYIYIYRDFYIYYLNCFVANKCSCLDVIVIQHKGPGLYYWVWAENCWRLKSETSNFSKPVFLNLNQVGASCTSHHLDNDIYGFFSE